MNSKPGATEYEVILRLRLAKGEDILAASTMASCPAPDKVTFSTFAARWLATYVATNNKPSEQRAKRFAMNHLLPAFGSLALGEIGPASIETFKAHQVAIGLSAKTVNNHLTILRTCLSTAVEWEELDSLPRIRRLRTRPPDTDYLSIDESVRLLGDDTEQTWHAMTLFALRTGMRLGELLALEDRDLDVDRGIVRVARSVVNGIVDTPKSNRVRYIPMTSDIAEFARTVRPGLLFPGPNGRPFQNYSAPDKAIKRLCRRTGLRSIGWHALRHTFASHLVLAGAPLIAVQQLLGHASITTTMRYAHLAPSGLRHAMTTLETHLAQPATPAWAQVGNTTAQVASSTPHLARLGA